ncbi:hypothetical protein GGX14DRAFT_695724 [Mycena pura]|uniref:Uncharacterized protein n=1 Tax=Mycena pura TaxID=153505 RepID=A0AAD6YK81_9AGAR|nr:hypothetical protein GGX14DRAFT_695724 [Mycena pura]
MYPLPGPLLRPTTFMMKSTVPPTTHSLPKPQRLRLMRTTRKLSALLGTPPQLMDPPVSPARDTTYTAPTPPPTAVTCAHARNGHSDSKSTIRAHPAPALLPVPNPSQRAYARPRLLAHVSPGPSGRRPPSQAWGRPPSVSPAGSMLPSFEFELDDGLEGSAVDTAAASAAARRKKVARVTRTLGEGVPLELIFPPPRRNARDRDSEMATAERTVGRGPRALTKLPPAAHLRRSQSLQSSGSSLSRWSSTNSNERSPGWISDGLHRSRSLGKRRPDRDRDHRSVTVRSCRGREWTGEWNQNEESVVRGLRELKQK